MDWHIITGEFPPKGGGVADYTWELAKALTIGADEEVHIWTPDVGSNEQGLDRVRVHYLPTGFGFRWLRALDRGLSGYGLADPLIVQYVPHMYGWKAMNLAFVLWLARQRHRKLSVMFHEVAFPLVSRQPLRHSFMAVVHRIMARIVLRRANFSFTSIEPYRQLLNRLAPDAQIELMRICSNVPFTWGTHETKNGSGALSSEYKTVGVFSSFGSEIETLIEPIIPTILKNEAIQIRLIGPAAPIVTRLRERYPEYGRRISTTGRVPASEVGPHLTACDVLLQLYPDGAAGARGTLVAALASGVPVISNYGHLTEPLFQANNALAFCECTPESVRDVIESLLTDDAAARELGIAGRRLYDTHFDISVAVKQLRTMVAKPVPSVRY